MGYSSHKELTIYANGEGGSLGVREDRTNESSDYRICASGGGDWNKRQEVMFNVDRSALEELRNFLNEVLGNE